ncbi:MAG: hypothetical protein QOE33_2965 [Acidobacteriota bacterium]|nr:hypothetical protein [Acidobacteriota bacterium]
MNKRQSSVFVLLLLAASFALACGDGKRSSAQDGRPPLNLESIRRDINGRGVETPSADGKSKPIGWVFVPEEPKEIEIVDQKIEDERATFLVNIKTRTVPRSRNPRRLEGQLRLHYELQSGLILRQWEIVEVENVSFTYVNETPPSPTTEKKTEEGDEDSGDSRGADAKQNANAANSNARPAASANSNAKSNAKPGANHNAPARP